MKKKGQVTIFIIAAILIVAGIVIYFSLGVNWEKSVPEDMRPIYDYYISCIENEAEVGISELGANGGYIDKPDFEAGNAYSPFSSQLNFFGEGVPYWMYLSSNNILKEQVPSKELMEKQLSEFVSERLASCDFSDFEAAGFNVFVEDGNVDVIINDENIDFKLNNKLTIYTEDNSFFVEKHQFTLGSKLGKFYDLAVKIFESEKSKMFLEDYAIDTMRLYAPVDGVDISCVPKIFVDSQIRSDLYDGLEVNMNSVKFDGSYQRISSEDRKYFVTDLGFDVDENINVMYNKDWPSKIEIYGDKVVSPVGIQPGLSALGFCYVPYHLVYDISFPVMIQLFDTENFFQFPIAVIIDKSQAREADSTYGFVSEKSKVCEYSNSEIEVYTYDSELNPVEASLTFRCLDGSCEIGETEISGSDAVYLGGVPQCVNGVLAANAPGYVEGTAVVSTNEEEIANILLKKKYELDLDFGEIDDTVVLTFVGEDYSTTVVYPEMNSVELAEGYYNISAYVYGDTTLTFPATKQTMCVDVPAEGLAGLLGQEKEKCYDLDIPSMDVDMAAIGGGKGYEYIAESVLKNSRIIKLDISLFGKPSSMDELQANYAEIENSMVFLEFEE